MRYLDVRSPVCGATGSTPQGKVVDEPAPASSFYHLVAAIAEISALARAVDRPAPNYPAVTHVISNNLRGVDAPARAPVRFMRDPALPPIREASCTRIEIRVLLALLSCGGHRPGADAPVGGPRSARRIPRRRWTSTSAVTMSPPCSSRTTTARTSRPGRAWRFSVGAYFRPIACSTVRNRCQRGLQVLDHGGRRMPTSACERTHAAARRVASLAEWLLPGWWAGPATSVRTVDGDGFFEDIDFDDAQGFNLEIGWRWISAALHRHEPTRATSYEDVDASHFGLRFTYRFGQQ